MEQVKEALDGGITFLQLREKHLGEEELLREAKDMKALAAAYHVPFIINEPACIFRQMFEAYLQEKSIRLDHTIELWSIHTIKNLVKNDVGITFLPRFAVAEELESGELEEIPTDMKKRHITAVCAFHQNKWVSPAMELFMKLLC